MTTNCCIGCDENGVLFTASLIAGARRCETFVTMTRKTLRSAGSVR